MMECNVGSCVRDKVNDEFCKKHELANKNIVKTFDKWQNAYGKEYKIEDYYERLANDPEIGAGEWVVEVAHYYTTLS